MKKNVNYSLKYVNSKNTDDKERAVLPTLIYAADKNSIASSKAIAFGWWCWGVCVIRTRIEVEHE